MSNNVVVKVKVEQLTKYGYKDAEGFVSYSKNLTDHDKALVVPGAEFEAELYTAPSGARYLNKIVARAPHVAAPKAVCEFPKSAITDVNPPVDVERAKKFMPKFTKDKALDNGTMSKDEWAAKDRRISRQGCIQVAVQVIGDWDKAVELANKMLEFVNG